MTAPSVPNLTKSRFLAGLQCPRRLWLSEHEPLPYQEPSPGSPQVVGQEIGRQARQLFPGGDLVDHPPWDHDRAVARTSALLADPTVPAIFEAAFEFDGVRIRADILERLANGTFGLREVKSAGSVKASYFDDLTIQVHVLVGAGLPLSSVQLVCLNRLYVRPAGDIDWSELFARSEVIDRVMPLAARVPDQLAEQWNYLASPTEPEIEPDHHCWRPHGCDYWARCTAGKPRHWIFNLPRMDEKTFADLRTAGVEAITAIPDNAPLNVQQHTIKGVLLSGRPFISENLAKELADFGPPALYLDFEAMSPAIPLYAGTTPFQTIPFQWSLHRLGADGSLRHQAFLACGDTDPRREFVETLIDAAGDSNLPILVYSPYEQTTLKSLAREFPDLAPKIQSIIDRLKDLLPVVRKNVYHPDFDCSFSIKAVAPALSPGFGYADLDGVADGQAAAAAFVRLASAEIPRATAEHAALRTSLLTYCERDTMAMVVVHRALMALADA